MQEDLIKLHSVILDGDLTEAAKLCDELIAAAPQPTKVAKYCDLCKDDGGYFYGRTGYEPCCVDSDPSRQR